MNERSDTSDERWELAHDFQDPILARTVCDVLKDAGVPARLGGENHRAALGGLGAFVSLPLHVPASRIDEARDVIASYLGDDATADPRGDAAPDSSDESMPDDRSAIRAVGIAFIGTSICLTVGLGQFYVRRTFAGAAIAIAGWSALYASSHGVALWPAIPILVVIDAVLAARVARDPNRPHHDFAVLGLIALALAAAPFVAAVLPDIDAWLRAPRRH